MVESPNFSVLVIGQSAREHALAWKLAQSDRVKTVYVAPGNAGTAREAKVHNLPLTKLEDILTFARDQAIDFTVVGPCSPLAAGIVDLFEQNGLKIFGPTRDASRLEWSKNFAKEFMQRHGIATPEYSTFENAELAKQHVRLQNLPTVIKADGLVQSFEMTVTVALTIEEADAAIDELFLRGESRILIEQFLVGEEVSFTVATDGEYVVPLASSRDHKRLFDGDRGPNTGGMGAFSPSALVTNELEDTILRTIVRPTLAGLAAEGIVYRGFLYIGLMVDQAGQPNVLEFNARLGDPEAQAILVRLDSDLITLLEAGNEGTLQHAAVRWNSHASVGICITTPEYPGEKKEHPFHPEIDLQPDGVKVFYGSATTNGESVVATGGRALCVTALGSSATDAAVTAYRYISAQPFGEWHYRKDIGLQ
ncbi:phosphoribosylamine--glycine ligase [Paraburkholderia strydomiana]|uniref:Phosphoribosylamine--glycine ligase n=1 Tax=Paraburkholderia strydomiana TaxID=1245417 RepID=A0ABW9EEY2_9BURK